MVEAAIFYPVIILAVMFVIYTCINMYSMAALQAKVHTQARAAAGLENVKVTASIEGDYENDRYRTRADGKKITISSGGMPGSRYVEASVKENYRGGRLIIGGPAKALFHSRSYVIDDSGAARLLRLIKAE